LVKMSWHPPISSRINSLSSAINGTGTYGFVFNSSLLPEGTPYGI
jgi:acid phosphatase